MPVSRRRGTGPAPWLAAALLLALGLALPARACTVSASAVAFGNYNPLAPLPDDATGLVSVSCPAAPIALLVSYSIALSPGGSGSAAERRMSAGAGTLAYQLYSDPLRSVVWGDGSGGSGVLHGTILLALLNVTTRQHPIYGRMPAGQTGAAAGSYGDSITVTVTY